jgi:hypothetical protein
MATISEDKISLQVLKQICDSAFAQDPHSINSLIDKTSNVLEVKKGLMNVTGDQTYIRTKPGQISVAAGAFLDPSKPDAQKRNDLVDRLNKSGLQARFNWKNDQLYAGWNIPTEGGLVVENFVATVTRSLAFFWSVATAGAKLDPDGLISWPTGGWGW